MAAHAAGELLAARITQSQPPQHHTSSGSNSTSDIASYPEFELTPDRYRQLHHHDQQRGDAGPEHAARRPVGGQL